MYTKRWELLVMWGKRFAGPEIKWYIASVQGITGTEGVEEGSIVGKNSVKPLFTVCKAEKLCSMSTIVVVVKTGAAAREIIELQEIQKT